MTEIYISCIFDLHSQVLAHSSPNSWNFLRRAMGSSFALAFDLLFSVSENASDHKGEMVVSLFIESPFPSKPGLPNELIFGKDGAGCQGNQI